MVPGAIGVKPLGFTVISVALDQLGYRYCSKIAWVTRLRTAPSRRG
jgi:hypothetical protein